MSGGHYDYKCFQISQFAEELQHDIDINNVKNEWGDSHDYKPETMAKLRKIQRIIKIAGDLAREVEWLYSGDHGEESFMKLANKIFDEEKPE